MEIESRLATAEDLPEIRHLLRHSRRSYASFGGEDLTLVVEENPFVVAVTGPLVWGVIGCINRENGWADVRAAALLDGWRYENAAQTMMPVVRESLRKRGVDRVLGLAQEDWLNRFFPACGFEKADEIIVYARLVSVIERSISGVEVRRTDDPKLLAALDRECFEPMWGMTEREFIHVVLLGGAVPLIAYVDGVAAGYVVVSPHRDVCEVVRLGVVEGHRHRGIGSALLQEAMEVCASSGTLSVLLNTQKSNEPARRLYESFGFRSFGMPVPVWVMKL